jgi:Domain of unknown function (DUF4384)
MNRFGPLALLLAASLAFAQSRTMTQGRHRMEIMLERLDGEAWHVIDPGLVLAQGDRVRFRFQTNFGGYLYVTNLNSSGQYQQLFPGAETGEDNHVSAAKEYQVPATSTVFRVAGPPGYETVYWLVSPMRINGEPSRSAPPPNFKPQAPLKLTPRCDDSILRARGDCVDSAAGPKLIPRGAQLPPELSEAAGQSRRDLLFMRQEEKSVISAPEPLSGPVIYEFRVAHR